MKGRNVVGIFDSIFRNKIGAPLRSEMLNDQLGVYQKIINIKNNMEQCAIRDFLENNDNDWLLVQAEKKRNDYLFSSGKLRGEDYVRMCNNLENQEKNLVSLYIDGSDDTTIYGILRNSLKQLKKNYRNLPNMDKMEFDLWVQIVLSSELATTTIIQIMGSDKYNDAVKFDQAVVSQQVRRKFGK